MTILKNKKIHLIIIVAIVSLVVVLLYPIGNKLLSILRNHDYPIKYGKEIIYSYINNGDIRIAKEILENKYEISRFNPVVIDKQTWAEDPFSDIYWRFNYYNLEPVRNLLFAWITTSDPVYKNKLIEIIESFIDTGIKGPYSWDYHGTAFRTMTLIDVREKLREKNELSADLDKKILATLKIHGDFLADPAHFEKDYNHGLDQSAALYLLAVNFPDMSGAKTWLELSSERITEMLSDIIDDDGILVENSPYYHFYVLEKFLEISKYLKQNNLIIDGFSDAKINKMISYAVYVLQPDLTVPTIGASLKRQINLSSLYKEVAESRPDLLYVLTRGDQGIRPVNLNIQYPVSGQTIMRSAWDNSNGYDNQTQIIFDVGSYRTNHSDLDALSFNLFGNGIALMPDAGLYTYETGPYRSYFHGTKSHNTVVVDGKDQSAGTASKKVSLGFFKEGDGYVYQSAEHTLYEGVSHKRAIVMIEDSTIMVLDKLTSSSEHTYEQMFHLFPGAKISIEGLTLLAKSDKPEQTLTIKQFATDGLELQTVIGKQDPPDGVCSFEYKIAVPCYAVSYMQKGTDVSYVTTISIGQNTADINFNKDTNLLTVKTKKGEYNININETKNTERSIDVDKKFNISQIYLAVHPVDSLNAVNEWRKIDAVDSVVNIGSAIVNGREKSLEITSPSDGSPISIFRDINLDLTNQNIYFKFKVDNIFNLQGFNLYLSNNNWTNYAIFNIKEVIVDPQQDVNRNNAWIQFGVAKGELRKSTIGGWVEKNSNFDWSKIDSIKLVVKSKENKNITINVKDFSLVPYKKEARAVIIFDDGWASVMDAVKIMNMYGLKGNIAVVANAVGKKNYLTLENLKTLQNEYGWDMANHSNLHKNAVIEYISVNDLEGFNNDLTDGLQYLIKNNLNSAPNWYIHPDGSIDNIMKDVINKYYKFARATINIPMVFPWPEVFEVGVLSMYSNQTQPLDAHNAISDAIKYNQTIFLMFHKISQGTPSKHTEYSLKDFNTIMKDIKKQGIKVVTLSELDEENGIPETEFVLHDASPGQFDLSISAKYTSSKTEQFINVFMDLWNHLIIIGNKII